MEIKFPGKILLDGESGCGKSTLLKLMCGLYQPESGEVILFAGSNKISGEKLAEYIANADLCLAGHFNRDIDKAQRTIPGKAYIYQSMQKVMICGDNRANRELFKEDSSVCFVPMGSAEKLRDAIDFICEQRYLGQIGA